MPLMPPIPLLAPEYLQSLPAPSTSLTPPDAPKMAPTPIGTPKCSLMSLYPFWPLSNYSPCQPQYTPNTPKQPSTPLEAPMPLMPPIPLLAPEYLQSLPVPNTPLTPPTPCHPQNGPPIPYTPSFLLSSLSIVVTFQLTIFMQLKCSFSIGIIFNYCHFATDCLHAVKMLIFYHCHFQLSPLCNWPSSGVCPLYSVPSIGVKGTSSVLWSSANFCSISQNMHHKAPVASQYWNTNKVVWTWKADWPTWRTSTYERPFTWEGNSSCRSWCI